MTSRKLNTDSPTNKTINNQLAGGRNNGIFKVYLHKRDEWIKFGIQGKWDKLGDNSFAYNSKKMYSHIFSRFQLNSKC